MVTSISRNRLNITCTVYLPLLYTHQCYQVLIYLISQSVIRCSGSPHGGSPLYETGDVVHNVISIHNAWDCDVIHIAQYKIWTTYFTYSKMKPTNITHKHKHIFLIHLKLFSTQDLVEGLQCAWKSWG